MDMRQLEYFVSVARNASFSRAAEERFTTQTTVSYHIGLLERELGVRLFDRHNKTVALTAAGAAYLPQAEEALRLLERASRDANAAQEETDGELRVGYFGRSCYDVLPSMLEVLGEQHPNLRLWVHQAPQSELVTMLREDALDCIFCTDYGKFSRLDWIQRICVSSDPIELLVRSDHWAAGRAAVRVDELADERFVVYAEKDLWEQDGAGLPIACRDIQYVDSHDDLVLLVKSGYAVSAGAHRALTGSQDGLKLVSFEDYHQYDNNFLCWKAGNQKEILHGFIQIVRASGPGGSDLV